MGGIKATSGLPNVSEIQDNSERTDIMFANPVVDLPSAFDRGTAEVLYHVPPTLRLVRP